MRSSDITVTIPADSREPVSWAINDAVRKMAGTLAKTEWLDEVTSTGPADRAGAVEVLGFDPRAELEKKLLAQALPLLRLSQNIFGLPEPTDEDLLLVWRGFVDEAVEDIRRTEAQQEIEYVDDGHFVP